MSGVCQVKIHQGSATQGLPVAYSTSQVQERSGANIGYISELVLSCMFFYVHRSC